MKVVSRSNKDLEAFFADLGSASGELGSDIVQGTEYKEF
ncbi:hypothetical protein PT7_2077 [Pusillimonas sp. T7-7]|nr:hypothetical protein PT7_2077 [Pusillimonas sp. T7-7]